MARKKKQAVHRPVYYVVALGFLLGSLALLTWAATNGNWDFRPFAHENSNKGESSRSKFPQPWKSNRNHLSSGSTVDVLDHESPTFQLNKASGDDQLRVFVLEGPRNRHSSIIADLVSAGVGTSPNTTTTSGNTNTNNSSDNSSESNSSSGNNSNYQRSDNTQGTLTTNTSENQDDSRWQALVDLLKELFPDFDLGLLTQSTETETGVIIRGDSQNDIRLAVIASSSGQLKSLSFVKTEAGTTEELATVVLENIDTLTLRIDHNNKTFATSAYYTPGNGTEQLLATTDFGFHQRMEWGVYVDGAGADTAVFDNIIVKSKKNPGGRQSYWNRHYKEAEENEHGSSGDHN